MKGIQRSMLMMICVALGVPGAAFSQAAPKPLSTSLGMVVFPAKGQTGVDPMSPPPATAGVMAGGRQSRKRQQQTAEQFEQQQQQATQQQQAAQQQQMDLFKKGFAACLEPKGCTVK